MKVKRTICTRCHRKVAVDPRPAPLAPLMGRHNPPGRHDRCENVGIPVPTKAIFEEEA